MLHLYALSSLILLLVFYSFFIRPIDIDAIILSIHPSGWSSMGRALCISLSVLGAAHGIYYIGSAMIGATVSKPEIFVKNLISLLFCEALAMYGVVGAALISPPDASLPESAAYFVGFSGFWCGLAIGCCNFLNGITFGTIGAATVIADAKDSTIFFKIFVYQGLASTIGTFGMIFGIPLNINSVNQFQER